MALTFPFPPATIGRGHVGCSLPSLLHSPYQEFLEPGPQMGSLHWLWFRCLLHRSVGQEGGEDGALAGPVHHPHERPPYCCCVQAGLPGQGGLGLAHAKSARCQFHLQASESAELIRADPHLAERLIGQQLGRKQGVGRGLAQWVHFSLNHQAGQFS